MYGQRPADITLAALRPRAQTYITKSENCEWRNEVGILGEGDASRGDNRMGIRNCTPFLAGHRVICNYYRLVALL